MDAIQCFMLERTDLFRQELRRYCSGKGFNCTEGYHDASVRIVEAAVAPECEDWEGGECGPPFPHDDPRWPTLCETCKQYTFLKQDTWQHLYHRLYRMPDGALLRPEEAPVGAMFYTDWWGVHRAGPDGHCLTVVLPERHLWQVEGPANNCEVLKECQKTGAAMPDNHFCWCRHGEAPNFTVDKVPNPARRRAMRGPVRSLRRSGTASYARGSW